MTDDHGPTVKALRHQKGKLKMVSREDTAPPPTSAINYPPEEMLRDIAKLIAANAQIGVAEIETAKFVVKYIRAWDREQRAKITRADGSPHGGRRQRVLGRCGIQDRGAQHLSVVQFGSFHVI